MFWRIRAYQVGVGWWEENAMRRDKKAGRPACGWRIVAGARKGISRCLF
jgi:hypothetical protein